MTDTKQNIQALKKSLPRVREKIIAVGLMLSISLAMMASVSYAWLGLSTAPEASSITTRISGNGSLEVALAGLYDENGKLIPPGASGVGDSFSVSGKDANLTWGNLINLSNNYGIESLVLRPATLNEGSNKFLQSIHYGADGRYETAATDFGLTSWTELDGEYSFAVTEKMQFGVRAVSSVTYPDGKSGLEKKLGAADIIWASSKDNYQRITQDGTYLTMLQSLMNVYIDAVLNDKDADCTDYIEDLYNMYQDLYDTVICPYGNALATMANVQLSFYSNTYTPYTRETLMSAYTNETLDSHVRLDNTLQLYDKIYKQVQLDLAALDNMRVAVDNGKTVTWSTRIDADGNVTTNNKCYNLENVVDHLVSINTAKINGYTAAELAGNISNALSIVSGGAKIVAHGGLLMEYEQLSGTFMYVNQINGKDFKLTVKYIMTVSPKATFQTELYEKKPQSKYAQDRQVTELMADDEDREFTGTMVAGDTYGMVIDLWVKTNAANSFLMLDGLAQMETYYEQKVYKILSGSEMVSRTGWLYTYDTGETNELTGNIMETIELYLIPEDLNGDGNIDEYVITATENGKSYTVYEGNFYHASSNDLVYRINKGSVTQTALTHEDVYPYLEKKERVIGFTSSNRVDDNYAPLDTEAMSSTQGSGSCYIFYADPENADATLELLSFMRFAFFDANNNKLATAKLDTEHYYANGGKYIVPMIIEETIATNENGDKCITNLVQNEAKLISVVVYLDGQKMENSMVMAADSIKGSLNLQFASSADLKSMENDDLSLQGIKLSAQASGGTEFDYDGSAHSNTLTAYISGMTPSKVEAIFQRKVNANQGSQMNPVELKPENGGWVGKPTFTMPGTYELNSLWVDGVEYDLPNTITVVVNGLNITSTTFPTTGSALIMTADNHVSRGVMVKIAADASTRPKSVTARFVSEDGKVVTAPLSYNDTYDYWEGNASFFTSGIYTLTSLMMDGSYFEIGNDASGNSLQKTVNIMLGLRAKVRLTSDAGLTFKYTGGTVNIGIMAEILTDTDASLTGLTGVVLSYKRQGSSVLENGLNEELEWNSEGYYSGTFKVSSPGTYSFAQITANGNVITGAISSQTIRAQSIEPPAKVSGYALWQSDGLNYIPNDSNTLFIYNDKKQSIHYAAPVSNASGAIGDDGNGKNAYVAVLTDPSGKKDVTVSGTLERIGEMDYVVFKISDSELGHMNGTWVVTELRFAGVFDREDWYGAEAEGLNWKGNYYSIAVNDSFTIIDDFAVSKPDAITLDTGKGFMEEQLILDQNGNPFQIGINLRDVELPESIKIQNVKMVLKHYSGSNVTYGGYSYNADLSEYENIELVLEYNQETGKWHSSSTASVRLAGTYTYESLSFDLVVDGVTKTFTYTGTKETVLTVKSVTPSVIVSAVSVSGEKDAYDSHKKTISWGGYKTTITTKKYTAGITNNSTVANVCFLGSLQDYGLYSYLNLTQPTVTLKLSGYGAADSVNLAFTENAHIYVDRGGSTKTDYSWSLNADGSDVKCTRYIGKLNTATASDESREKAGTITADTLVIVFEGVTFTVKIPTITINNPY